MVTIEPGTRLAESCCQPPLHTPASPDPPVRQGWWPWPDLHPSYSAWLAHEFPGLTRVAFALRLGKVFTKATSHRQSKSKAKQLSAGVHRAFREAGSTLPGFPSVSCWDTD